MILIDGKSTSLQIQEEIKARVELRAGDGHKKPHLAAIIVGDNPASRAYVGHKIKACERVGFESTLVELSESVQEEQLLMEVEALNNDESIDGFIVQLPLPDHIDDQKVLEAVRPDKTLTVFTQ